MTKLVNLDDLAAPRRTVVYKNASHDVLDLKLADFVTFQKKLDELLEAQVAGEFESVFDIAEVITKIACPTFPTVRTLNMRQLMALIQLIADFFPQEADQGNDALPPTQQT